MIKKKTKEKELQLELDICKQFIKLTLGDKALDRINRQIDIEKTNKLLTIEKPEAFNKLITERATLNKYV